MNQRMQPEPGPPIDVEQAPGTAVADSTGERLGEIEDVYLDNETHEAELVLVLLEGGSQASFVPLAGAQMHGEVLQVAFRKAQVVKAPQVGSDQQISPDEKAALYRYYEQPAARDIDVVKPKAENAEARPRQAQPPPDAAEPQTQEDAATGTEARGQAEPPQDYAERTVEELRQLAAERDIEGRSSMRKDELVNALRDDDAHRYTLEELKQLAAERDLKGRSSMSKDELLAALRAPEAHR